MRSPLPLRLLRIFPAAVLSIAVFVSAGCNRTSTSATNPSQSNPQGANNPAGIGGNASDAAQSGSTPGGSNPQTAPAPPPKPSPIRVTVASGTLVPVRINHSLSTKTATAGETFTGTLYAPLQDPSGAVAFPQGTPVVGTVVASKSKGRFKGAGILALRLRQIGGESVRTSEYAITTKGKGKRTAGFIGGGAGGGALIGGLAGGGKGALLGGLLGGGAGTVGAAFTGNKPIFIPAESKLRFRLTAPVSAVIPQ